MGRVFFLLLGFSVVTSLLAAPKKSKNKEESDDEDMSELNLVDYGGNAYGGTEAPTATIGVTSVSNSQSISVNPGSMTSLPPTQASNTLIPATGSSTPAVSGPRQECWLQLGNGQWIWNKYHRDYQGQLRCGGWVRLPNCQWHWTDQPGHYYPVVCYDIHWQDGSKNDHGDDHGDNDGDDHGDDNGDKSDNGPGPTERPPNDVTSDNGDNGDGNVQGSSCTCAEWDFPGECGTDGMIFRWRTCEPRYCNVEDEYVPCE